MSTGGRRTSEITDAQWRRLEELLPAALELSGAARAAFLDAECGADDALRAELDSLLSAHETNGPLDQPLVQFGKTAPLPRAPHVAGSIVAHYELQEQLGTGGMGVVHRARDLRLDRIVALKFLPAAVGADAHAKRRFLTEARAAAALEHSNVCTIHEIGETEDGQLFIAMAFVDGASLRQLIDRGPLPVERAVEIARQIAAALQCAHSHQIVHRDIKPANVMIGKDGVVRLVDFGIAKLAGLTLTQPGLTPGTAAYMAPEQVRGEDVDARADVWALGVVLYEMLAGRRPFTGDADAVVLHAIATAEPASLRTVRPDIPAELQRIVTRALAKDRAHRFQSAAEMRDALRRISGDTPAPHELGSLLESSTGSAPAYGGRNARRLQFAAALLLLVTAMGGAYLWFGRGNGASTETLRLSISAPGTVTPQLSAAISPDGRQVAFVATDASGLPQLWVRALNQLQARPLAGTQRAAHPFWSPDSRSLGFIADNQLKRIDLADGSVQTLADTVVRFGPAWAPDGTILFSRRIDELAAVSAGGGPVRTVLRTDSTRRQHMILWPRFLPDGRHFIYFAGSSRPEHTGIYVGSLDSDQTKLVMNTDFRAWYALGRLLFLRGEAVLAQPFDVARFQVHGEPMVIADGVWYARPAAQASFSVSETGTLAYVNATLWDGELIWFDRAGRALGSAGPAVRHEGVTPQISRDGRRIAVTRGEFGREDIWLLGAAGESPTRLTFTTESDGMPVWSGDSRRIMFGTTQLFVRDVDAGTEEMVMDSAPGQLLDWSRDGRFVVFQRSGSRAQLWYAQLANGSPLPFLEGPYNMTQAQLSPDGKWIAYTSNESGRDEIYVQAFPVPGRKRQVSNGGGAMPRWRQDGRELFYLAGNQYITAVSILDSVTVTLGPPTPLFRTRLVVEGSESVGLPVRYDVAPDGQRFLIRYPPADPGPPITVVINWLSALNR